MKNRTKLVINMFYIILLSCIFTSCSNTEISTNTEFTIYYSGAWSGIISRGNINESISGFGNKIYLYSHIYDLYNISIQKDDASDNKLTVKIEVKTKDGSIVKSSVDSTAALSGIASTYLYSELY